MLKSIDGYKLLDFRLSPEKEVQSCIYHRSIIANYFKEIGDDFTVLKSYTKAEDIVRNRNQSKRARGLLKERKTIEDFDDINNVLKKFREWRRSYWSSPKNLHAHGYTEKGELREKTWHALNRFETNRNIENLSEALKNYRGKGVFLTLTVDHTKSLRESWETIAQDWHKFITRLVIELTNDLIKNYERKRGYPLSREKRKELRAKLKTHDFFHYIYVLEAQGNGYPHIHALFLGLDWLYYAGNKHDWQNDNPHSKNLKHFWHRGSVFVNSTKSGQNINSPVNYLMKYIRKTFDRSPDDNGKKELTQAMLWAFNKRSFNTSRGLLNFLKFEKKPKEIVYELHGMAHFEDITGKTTPLIRIETIKPEIHTEPELEVLTIDDIPELEILAGEMRITPQELKALNWLTYAKNHGKNWTFNLNRDGIRDRDKRLRMLIKRLRAKPKDNRT